jgi:hypothetical protein
MKEIPWYFLSALLGILWALYIYPKFVDKPLVLQPPCTHYTLQLECVKGKICQLKEWEENCKE